MSEVTNTPHDSFFNQVRSKLTDAEYDAIVNELDQKISGDEVHTSSWMPGSDWAGSVFEPIETACGGDRDISGRFFGLVVWKVFQARSDTWSFGRYPNSKGMTYFKI
jgi:hypothetical protein